MRLSSVLLPALAAAACASPKPAPAPGAFERVAERLNESHSLLGVLDPERRAEIDAERPPAERRSDLLVAVREGEVESQRRIEDAAKDKDKQPPAGQPADRPRGKYGPPPPATDDRTDDKTGGAKR